MASSVSLVDKYYTAEQLEPYLRNGWTKEKLEDYLRQQLRGQIASDDELALVERGEESNQVRKQILKESTTHRQAQPNVDKTAFDQDLDALEAELNVVPSSEQNTAGIREENGDLRAAEEFIRDGGQSDQVLSPDVEAPAEGLPETINEREENYDDIWNGNPPYTKEELDEYIQGGYTRKMVDEYFKTFLSKMDEQLQEAIEIAFERPLIWKDGPPYQTKELLKFQAEGKTEADLDVKYYRIQLEKQASMNDSEVDKFDIEYRVSGMQKKLNVRSRMDNIRLDCEDIIQEMKTLGKTAREAKSFSERQTIMIEQQKNLVLVRDRYDEYTSLWKEFHLIEEEEKNALLDRKYQMMLKKKLEQKTEDNVATDQDYTNQLNQGEVETTSPRSVMPISKVQYERWFTMGSSTPTEQVPKAPRIRLPPPPFHITNDRNISAFEKEEKLNIYHSNLLSDEQLHKVDYSFVSELNLSYQSLGQAWQFDALKKHLELLPHLVKLYATDNSLQTMKGITLKSLKVFIACRNEFQSFDELPTCPVIEEMNLAANHIDNTRGMTRFTSLKKLILRGNPISRRTEYKMMIVSYGPKSLERLDDQLLTEHTAAGSSHPLSPSRIVPFLPPTPHASHNHGDSADSGHGAGEPRVPRSNAAAPSCIIS